MAFVCVQGPKSMCTKQHFGLCTDFNLSDKNLIQLCFSQRELKQIDFSVLRSTAGSISPLYTGANNGGSVRLWSRACLCWWQWEICRLSQECCNPTFKVHLFLLPNILFSAVFFTVLTESFVKISQQHQQSITEVKLLIIHFEDILVQNAMQIDKK